MPRCRWRHISNKRTSGQKVSFFFQAKHSTLKRKAKGSGEYSYLAHHPLCSAHIFRSSSRAKVVDAASGDGEAGKLFRLGDSLWKSGSFKVDLWKHFGFSVS